MNDKDSQTNKGLNSESGPVVDQKDTGPFSGHSKTDSRYWLRPGRLVKRRFSVPDPANPGKTIERESPDFSMRIASRGRREWFQLGTANRKAAAAKAAEIASHLLGGKDWDSTVAKFKPAMTRTNCVTVGEYLDAVKAHSELRSVTFEIYARKFRTLLAGAFGIKASKAVFYHAGEVRKNWVGRINRIRLARITDARIDRWKVKYLKAAEKEGPIAYKNALATVNSIMRGAKALFAKDVVNRLGMKMPEPLPFSGVANVQVERQRYRSKVDPQALLIAGKNELSSDHKEEWKALLLCLCLGLRRGEVDRLEWKAMDFQRNVIHVETTKYGAPKSDSSEADVDVDPNLMAVFKEMMSPNAGEFVIKSKSKPRKQVGATYSYRAERVFKNLIKWLRGKCADTKNPLHTCRKEFGSLVARQAGIFAASLALRHADIQQTRDYYLDKKQAVFLDFKEMAEPKKEPETIAKPA